MKIELIPRPVYIGASEAIFLDVSMECHDPQPGVLI